MNRTNKLSLTLLSSTFDVGGNEISGSLPTEIGLLYNLFDLVLADNQLTGSVPSQLGTLSSLILLDLGYNNAITGTIPTELGFVPNVFI
jgi:Leucine-rich repeat (LRR) protein